MMAKYFMAYLVNSVAIFFFLLCKTIKTFYFFIIVYVTIVVSTAAGSAILFYSCLTAKYEMSFCHQDDTVYRKDFNFGKMN